MHTCTKTEPTVDFACSLLLTGQLIAQSIFFSLLVGQRRFRTMKGAKRNVNIGGAQVTNISSDEIVQLPGAILKGLVFRNQDFAWTR